MPRFAQFSPDGSKIVFESLGRLWIKSSHDSKARRLTQDNSARRELFPSWSSNGRKIAFVAWQDQSLGTLKSINATGGSENTITPHPGHYRRPRFSPDDQTLVFEKGAGGRLTSPNWSEQPGIYQISSRGGDAKRIVDAGNWPHFASDPERIFFTRSGDEIELVSVNLNGLDERVHASASLVSEYQVSPDGKQLAFSENYDVHIMPMLPGPQSLASGRGAGIVPQVEVSGDGGNYMHWSMSGERINWSLGPDLFSANLNEAYKPEAEEDTQPGDTQKSDIDGETEQVKPEYVPPTQGVDLTMEVTADKPEGTTRAE